MVTLFKDITYLKTKRFWEYNDIQKSLDYLLDNKKERETFINYLDNEGMRTDNGDYIIIEKIIETGISEYFENFDSDVCETYISEFQKKILKI